MGPGQSNNVFTKRQRKECPKVLLWVWTKTDKRSSLLEILEFKNNFHADNAISCSQASANKNILSLINLINPCTEVILCLFFFILDKNFQVI